MLFLKIVKITKISDIQVILTESCLYIGYITLQKEFTCFFSKLRNNSFFVCLFLGFCFCFFEMILPGHPEGSQGESSDSSRPGREGLADVPNL